MISLSDRKKAENNLILLIHDDSSILVVFRCRADPRVVNTMTLDTNLFRTFLVHLYVMKSLNLIRRHIRPLIRRTVVY